MQSLLKLDALPVWSGVTDRPGNYTVLPFSIGWDPVGFVRQTTDSSVIEEVLNTYAAENYAYSTKPPGLSAWSNRLGEMRIKFVAENIPEIRAGDFLEVGGGSTYVGERMIHNFGAASYTLVDPAVRAGENFSERLTVIPDYFDAKLVADCEVDGIFGFHVFEHLLDPLAFLQAARSTIVARDGRIVLTFPDSKIDMARGTPDGYVHEHIGYFTDASARTVFSEAGFIVQHHEWHGGVLSYLLAVDRTGQPSEKPPAKPVPLEVADMGRRFWAFVEAARACFDAILDEGETICIHGATNGINTLMFLLGERYAAATVVFDGDDSKTGLFLPCVPNQIRHTMDGSYAGMKRVFVAVPGYFDEIAKTLRKTHGLGIARLQRLEDIMER